MDGYKIKQTIRNFTIDAASILIFIAITYVAAQGIVTLYTAYYNTLELPTPDVFQAASLQFTAAISLSYLFMQTRKHRGETPKEQRAEAREIRKEEQAGSRTP